MTTLNPQLDREIDKTLDEEISGIIASTPNPTVKRPWTPSLHEQRVAKEKREALPPTPWGEVIGKVAEHDWIIPNIYRFLDRRLNREGDDNNYRPTEEQIDEIILEFDTKTMNRVVNDSLSYKDFQNQISYIRADKKRHMDLANAGGRGAFARVVVNMLDPVNFISGYAIGGIGAVRTGSQILRVAKVTGAAMVEGAITEALVRLGDESDMRDASDIAYAALGSGIFVGALNLRFKGIDAADFVSPGQRLKTKGLQTLTIFEGLKRSARHVDEMSVHAINEINTGIILRKAAERYDSIDSAVDSVIRRKSQELRKATQDLDKVILVGKKQAKLKADIKRLRKANKVEGGTPELRILRGQVKRLKKSGKKIEAVELERSVNERVKLDTQENSLQIELLQDQLRRSNIGKKIKKDEAVIANLSKMSRDEKIAYIIPDAKFEIKLLKQIEKRAKARRAREKVELAARIADAQVIVESKAKVDETTKQVKEILDHKEGSYEYMTDGATVQEGLDVMTVNTIHTEAVTKQLPLPAFLKNKIQSMYTTLDHSVSAEFRALKEVLFENPQGNVFAPETVAINKEINLDRIRSASKNSYWRGYLDWRKERGDSFKNTWLDMDNQKAEFNNKLFLQILYPDDIAPKPIKLAAEGANRQYNEALKLLKVHGVQGFEDVKSGNYIQRILNAQGVDDAVALHGRDEVIRLLARSYETGDWKLTPETAKDLARTRIDTSRDTTLSTILEDKTVRNQRIDERLEEELTAAGVEDDIIQQIINQRELDDIAENISNRARFGTGMNARIEIETSKGTLSMVDILETNVPQLMDDYAREAAGMSAFAQKGFKNPHQFRLMIDKAEKNISDAGSMPKAARIEQAQILRDGITMIMGRSIDKEPSGNIAKNLRRVREWTANTMLAQVGFAQVPELGRAFAEFGVWNTLSQIPATAIFRRRGARVDGTEAGSLKYPLAREAEEDLYHAYVGEESWETPVNMRAEEFGELAGNNWFGKAIDNINATGAKINNVLSGFQAVQGGINKVVQSAISNKMVRMAEGKLGRKNMFTKQTLNDMGWTDEFVDDLMKYIKDNPMHAEYNGKKIRLMNIKNMSHDMRHTYRIGTQRLGARMSQRSYIGETSQWMNTAMGKIITQFRSFSIVSLEKQLLHDINGDKVGAAMALSWATLLSMVTYSTQVTINSVGKDDPEEYLDKMLSDSSFIMGTLRKLPSTAGAFDIVLGVGGNIGAVPTSLGRYAQEGFGFSSIPAVSFLDKGRKVLSGFGDNARSDESDFIQMSKDSLKMVPLVGNILTGPLMNAGLNRLGD